MANTSEDAAQLPQRLADRLTSRPGGKPSILFFEPHDPRVRAVATALGRSEAIEPVMLTGDELGWWAGRTVEAEGVRGRWMAQGDETGVPGAPAEVAAAAVSLGLVDAAIGGVATTSREVLRAGLRFVGSDGVVSCGMLALPRAGKRRGRALLLADCAVLLQPTASQLAALAVDSAMTWQSLTGEPAVVAVVSAATKGSVVTPHSTRICEAIEIVRERCPELTIDGELQADAAVDAEIARAKDPQGVVAGRANVLVFPDLVSANVCYKLLQHVGNCEIATLTQGFRHPFFDVSRGAAESELMASALLAGLADSLQEGIPWGIDESPQEGDTELTPISAPRLSEEELQSQHARKGKT